MVKSSRYQHGTSSGHDRLWLHLGNRLQFRRQQLGIDPPKAAAHVGVTLQTYDAYETGERLIPAKQLAELAELFAVPVFYFFEDLQIGEESPDVQQVPPDAEYVIATQNDRIAALVDDFQKLDFERQQHLLLIARALANHPPSGKASP